MLRLLSVIGILGVLAAGCGGDEAPADAARSRDAGVVDDASATEDAPTEMDAASEIDAHVIVVDDTGIDAIEIDATMDDASGPDVFVGTDAWTPDAYLSPPDSPAPIDVGTDAARPDLGPVQCTPTLECPAGAGLCNDTAPGGVCSCFLGTEACPSGTTCDTDIGACIRACTTELDCSAGMTCSTLTGRCQIRRCGSMMACPAPYVCSSAGGSGFCRRPSCAGGASCPTSMTCVGDVCVEP